MPNQINNKYFEYTLLALILLIGYALITQALPFVNGILGAITLYILLRRPNFYMIKRYGKGKAPWIITIGATLFVLVPLSALAWYAIDLIQRFDFNINVIIQKITTTTQNIETKTGIDILSDKSVSFITGKITAIANMFLAGINNFAINLFTAILLLYFLLAGGVNMERYITRLLPFAETNKKTIIHKINLIVKSNAIGIPLLALLQGIVAAIGYYLCGVNNPVMFGSLTGLASVIPIVGTMIVWIPLCIAQYFEGSIGQTIALFVYCVIIISQCDNVMRMFLQKKMADTHPLITVFGVIAGLPIFGFMGIIFGPLLVAMFLLFLDMFAKQYIIGATDKH